MGSSGNGPNSIVQNPDRKDFTWYTKNTRFRSASSRLELGFEKVEIDETSAFDNSEHNDFAQTRFTYT